MKELEKNELLEVDGGFWFAVLVGGFIYDCISDPGSCIRGFRDGYNSN